MRTKIKAFESVSLEFLVDEVNAFTDTIDCDKILSISPVSTYILSGFDVDELECNYICTIQYKTEDGVK